MCRKSCSNPAIICHDLHQSGPASFLPVANKRLVPGQHACLSILLVFEPAFFKAAPRAVPSACVASLAHQRNKVTAGSYMSPAQTWLHAQTFLQRRCNDLPF